MGKVLQGITISIPNGLDALVCSVPYVVESDDLGATLVDLAHDVVDNLRGVQAIFTRQSLTAC